MYIKINKWINEEKTIYISSEIVRTEEQYTIVVSEASDLGYYIEEEWISYLEYLKIIKASRRGNARRVQNINK